MLDQPDGTERFTEQLAQLTSAMRAFEVGCAGAAVAVAKFNRDLNDAMNWAVSLHVLRSMARRPAP